MWMSCTAKTRWSGRATRFGRSTENPHQQRLWRSVAQTRRQGTAARGVYLQAVLGTASLFGIIYGRLLEESSRRKVCNSDEGQGDSPAVPERKLDCRGRRVFAKRTIIASQSCREARRTFWLANLAKTEQSFTSTLAASFATNWKLK